jgi:hypothetical protein
LFIREFFRVDHDAIDVLVLDSAAHPGRLLTILNEVPREEVDEAFGSAKPV